MKKLFLIALLLFSGINANALYEVGDTIPNMQWINDNGNKISMTDYPATLRVLLYNGGFCGPCVEEFAELIPRLKEIGNAPATLLSLSVADWEGGKPTQEFLKEWRDRFGIQFPVAAATRKEAGQFFETPAIPNVVMINKNNILVYKGIEPGVDVIFSEIKKEVGKR